MMTKQVSRSPAYKLRIATMIVDGGSKLTELAEKENVPYNTVWTWVKKLKADRGEVPEPQPKPAKVKRSPEPAPAQRYSNEYLENRVLKLEEKVAAYKSALKFALEG